MRELFKRVRAELDKLGIEIYRFDKVGKHARVVFDVNGKTMFYILAKSPSDWRAAKNVVSDIRRMVRSAP